MRCRWCNTIALKVQATIEEKRDDSKDGFSEEFEHVFNHF
jgi:hypothetical protein